MTDEDLRREGWRPAETAPKDGQFIEVISNWDYRDVVAWNGRFWDDYVNKPMGAQGGYIDGQFKWWRPRG